MSSVFSVTAEDLRRLNPNEAVDIFRELLWAEASYLGIGRNLINVPSAITVSDGGVDAEVTNVLATIGHGIVKPGNTRYQIKTGDFNISKSGSIDEILFREKMTELRPRIKSCLENQGTLVVVLFGWDNPDKTEGSTLQKFRDKLECLGYPQARIEICRANNIMSFLQPFPSLALRVNRRGIAPLQTYESWSSQQDMRGVFQPGQPQLDCSHEIEDRLRRSEEIVHVRISGVPGIGKTRIALEATRGDDLRPFVLYTDSPGGLKNSAFMNELLMEDNCYSLILVIDECDDDDAWYFWNKLHSLWPRVKLITIFPDTEGQRKDTVNIRIPPLNHEPLSQIISGYGMLAEDASRWAERCGGLPRVAHVFGNDLAHSPTDVLTAPNVDSIWKRYITRGDKTENPTVRHRRVVLENVALFKRFGFGGTLLEDTKSIYNIVARADISITWSMFEDAIHDLRTKKMVQGVNILYITPEAFHIWLWSEWWKKHGASFDFNEFCGRISGSMRHSFFEMLEYANHSREASRIVKELLMPEGPFKDSNYIDTKDGARLILSLASADPKSAVACLQRMIVHPPSSSPSLPVQHRPEVLLALRRIAAKRQLFAHAARVLAVLAESEIDDHYSQARDAFCGLFSNTIGGGAPSEASPFDRLEILKDLVASGSEAKIAIAIAACDVALELGGRPYDTQIPSNELEYWMPRSSEDLWDAYGEAWHMLRVQAVSGNSASKRRAAEILLKHTRSLIRIGALSNTVIETLVELSHKPEPYQDQVLTEVIHILRHDRNRLTDKEVTALISIREMITGDEFATMMTRYVRLRLFEDWIGENGEENPSYTLEVKKLAGEAAACHTLLEKELRWLVTSQARNGYSFGYELGKQDSGESLLSTILDAQRNSAIERSTAFLGGYLKAIHEGDKERWETLLDKLTEDPHLRKDVPALTWHSGISDRAATRIMGLAKNGCVGPSELRVFSLGTAIREISYEAFKEWVDFLHASLDPGAPSLLLYLYHLYYVESDPNRRIPSDLTLEVLKKPFDANGAAIEVSQMDDYLWTGIAKTLIDEVPGIDLKLLELMIEHHVTERTSSLSYPDTWGILKEILRDNPTEAWRQISGKIDPPIDAGGFKLGTWLRGEDIGGNVAEPPISLLPIDDLLNWIEESSKLRALLFASIVPPNLSLQKGGTNLTREYIVRYGTRSDVKSVLMANFSTESWSGPRTDHLKRKIELLRGVKAAEDNRVIVEWLAEYISSLEDELSRSIEEEERESS